MSVLEIVSQVLVDRIKVKKIMTARKLAETLEVSETAVGKWLKGGSIDLEKVPAICKALQITPNDLLGFVTDTEDQELLDILHNDPDLKQYVLSRRAK